MALIGLCAAKSGGVTTTALALAYRWPRPVVVADCDAAAGDTLVGLFEGQLKQDFGLFALNAAMRKGEGAQQLAGQLIGLDNKGRVHLLPGFVSPAQAGAFAPRWGALADMLSHLVLDGEPVDVLADCGRLQTMHAPRELLRRADLTVLVSRLEATSIVVAGRVLRQQDEIAPDFLVGVEDGAYDLAEAGEYLDLLVAGSVAWDPAPVQVLRQGARVYRHINRSELFRTASAIARRLSAAADRPAAGGRIARPPTARREVRHA